MSAIVPPSLSLDIAILYYFSSLVVYHVHISVKPDSLEFLVCRYLTDVSSVTSVKQTAHLFDAQNLLL